jgi:predicted ATP-grasp superfamily ATP-dependent carboligase
VSNTAVPDPLSAPESFVSAVRALVRRNAIDVLLPVSEASVLAVLGDDDLPREVVVPFGSLAVFRNVCDKQHVGRIAAGLGLSVPRQTVLADRAAAAALEADDLRLPVVVKPSRSVVGGDGRRIKTGVVQAATRMALRQAIDSFPAEAYPLLVQERIVGPGVGAFLLHWNGEAVASFCHRRLREKPPSGGVSVLRESS